MKGIINMKNISKYKIDNSLLVILILFATISIITIYSAQSLLGTSYQDLYLRQIMWYVIGFILAYLLCLLEIISS